MPPTSRAKAVAITLLSMAVAVAAGDAIGNGKPFYPDFDDCPAPCVAGSRPDNWTTYHEVDRLTWCNQTMLIDFAVYNALEDPKTHASIRSCVANTAPAAVSKLADSYSSACGKATKVQADLQLAWWAGSKDSASVIAKEDVIAAVRRLQSHLSDGANCDTTVAFGYSGSAAVGAYVGSNIEDRGAAMTAVQEYINHVQTQGISGKTLVQLCGSNRDSDYAFGIVADRSSNLPSVQNAVRTWSDANCVGEYEGAKSLASSIWLTAPFPVPASNITLPTEVAHTGRVRRLQARATCKTIQVAAGDSCASLATKCGISGADFTKYNSASTLCSTLQPGQHICCSSGTLPDFTPKPSSDGTCAVYTVKAGDYCYKIASSYGLTPDKLESFNKNTWGWGGCANLQAGIIMCLSTGNSPMPASVSNAVCGPQKPGSQKPANGQKLADLNPCPLNACCNIWGQCGTTGDFCTVTKSSTGAPGTAAPGTNGCISNCGTGIVNNASPPSSFINLGYFEAWNKNRKCLTMDVGDINTKKYTHIHFAFATITTDFKVDVSKVQAQFDKFTKMSGVKRILSFGGWSFSTDQDTYPIFRQSVTPANAQTFANNVISFLKQHNLDGLDFDWEYPGAPDIPGIPAGGLNEGKNYLAFLKLVRSGIPSGKSLSVAAPASYWYLRGFPIKDIAGVVDYIVYMTYDLHGQWDYGSKWSNPGCPSGNCLRSHINMTETINALSMVTKAGVPAAKVVVGVSSYGRSFKMTTKGCDGVSCTFVGPNSGATPGACTGQAGYIADAEIQDIIARGSITKKWYDQASRTNILVYNDVQWVSYMDAGNKADRAKYYKGLNLGGITDWAIDLQTFLPGDKCPANSPDCDTLLFVSKSSSGIDWTAEQCTNPVIVDAAVDPKKRWYGVGCDAAWQDAVAYWKASPGRGGLNFPETISNFFHGPEGMACDLAVDHNGCSSFTQCQSTNHPAGYLVLNSMVALNNILWNFYDAIVRIQSGLSDTMGGIQSTFAPIPNDSKALKIALDILGLSYALFAAPMWNIAFKKLPYFIKNGNELGTAKDTANGVVSNTLTIVKDKAPTSALDITSDLKEKLAFMSKTWYESTAELQKQLFNGSDSSINTLTNIIKDGKLLENAYEPIDDLTIQHMMSRALHAILIPVAWSLTPQLGVVVIDAKSPCSAIDPLDESDLVKKDSQKSWVCHKDKLYYLVGAKGDQRTCNLLNTGGHSGQWDCYPNPFSLPPGLTELTGGDAWGGLTRENFVHGALNTFEANGNKNGAAFAGPILSDASLNAIQEIGVTAPGVVILPVCDIKEARSNWETFEFSKHLSTNYPCN